MTTATLPAMSNAEKNVLISSRILELVAKGAQLNTAINVVLGPGTFEKMTSDLYDALRK